MKLEIDVNITELIQLLESQPDKYRVCRYGIIRWFSWRGHYSELAFAVGDDVTIETMLNIAKNTIGETLSGWKGGTWEVNHCTPIHLEDNYGSWTDGDYAADVIKKIDSSIDVEGRREEWLVKKAIELMLK
jgi:hypothetical protein